MLIIDCNNLWFAAMVQAEPLNGISRDELLDVLDYYARRSGQDIVAALDGRRRGRSADAGNDSGGCRPIYAGAKSADDVINQLVDESSEPRRLTVVSSDRQLIRQVRKRRVRVVDSQVFARRLVRWLNRPIARGGGEPPTKQGGLGGSGHLINQWLIYFDLQAGKSDIIDGERAGKRDGGQSRQVSTRSSQVRCSPDVVAESHDAEARRAFRDVQPLKRRKRRRISREGGGNDRR